MDVEAAIDLCSRIVNEIVATQNSIVCVQVCLCYDNVVVRSSAIHRVKTVYVILT